MYDVPFMLTKGQGAPNFTTKTVVMLLNDYLQVNNYGMAGTIAVLLFIVTGALSFAVFKAINKEE
jgi:multiple sugar transport system permease protein